MQNQKTLVIRRESMDIFSLCCLAFLPSINNFINSLMIKGFGMQSFSITPVIYIFIALLGARALLVYVLPHKGMLLAFALLLAGMWLSYFLYSPLRNIIYTDFYDLVYNPMNKVVFFCFPAVALTLNIHDYDGLLQRFIAWSRVTTVVGVFTYVYVSLIVGERLQYMVFSYFMLTAICICAESFYKKHNLIDLLLVILGSISVVLCGARGAVVALAIYLMVRYVLMNEKWSSGVRFTVCLIAGVVLLIVFINLNAILLALKGICDQLGVDSRIITYTLEGSLTESAGRTNISTAISAGLWSNPLGYGLFGDRYVTGQFGYSSYTYAHNMFLEAWCTFGVLIGTILLAVFFWHFIKTLLKKKNPSFHAIYCAIIPYAVIQLMFSSSMMENILFYALCGLIIKSTRDERRGVEKGA